MDKADGAFLTIGELAQKLGVPQHILRYWESRFPQLRPLQRAGNRRYYRPSDVVVAERIYALLNDEGFTIRGAQRALTGKAGGEGGSDEADNNGGELRIATNDRRTSSDFAVLIARLTVIRESLSEALGLAH